MFDPEGRLWIAHRGGGTRRVQARSGLQQSPRAINHQTQTLVASASGARSSDQLVRLPASPARPTAIPLPMGSPAIPLAGEIYQSADGRIWIGTDGGLTVFSDGRFRSYTMAQGLEH